MRARRADAGFSIVEVLVILAVVSIIGMIAVSQFVRAFDRARQRGTLADMRSIAGAAGTYQVDHGSHPESLEDLKPYYLAPVATVDRWGTAWTFEGDGTSYRLSSLGSDGVAGPAAPEEWYDEPFEVDLVVSNGAFTQAPATSGQ